MFSDWSISYSTGKPWQSHPALRETWCPDWWAYRVTASLMVPSDTNLRIRTLTSDDSLYIRLHGKIYRCFTDILQAFIESPLWILEEKQVFSGVNSDLKRAICLSQDGRKKDSAKSCSEGPRHDSRQGTENRLLMGEKLQYGTYHSHLI